MLLELHYVIVIKYVTFVTVWVKLTDGGIHIYQFTFKPLHFCFQM